MRARADASRTLFRASLKHPGLRPMKVCATVIPQHAPPTTTTKGHTAMSDIHPHVRLVLDTVRHTGQRAAASADDTAGIAPATMTTALAFGHNPVELQRRVNAYVAECDAIRAAPCPNCGRSIGYDGHAYAPCTIVTGPGTLSDGEVIL